MVDLLEITETKISYKNKYNNSVETDNKVLYLKLTVAEQNYLILLSDITELKNTNLITPVQGHSLKEQNILGTFYYQHKIIPVYKLRIEHEANRAIILLDHSAEALKLKKYYNLLILHQNDHMGFVIAEHTVSEIVDMNFVRARNNIEHLAILDIKKVINKL
jgi:hypothetical protein